uniref:MauE/DoxX family redox-associated membrane protein n=1 Tax=Pedobacter schmidteae TaxID=2201271 RepID=UPI003743C6E5
MNTSYIIKGNGILFSVLIPFSELLIVLFLLFDKTRMPALISSFALLIIFTAYIVYILNFAPSVPCSCGGVISKLSWSGHLVFNGAFITIHFIGIILLRQGRSSSLQSSI